LADAERPVRGIEQYIDATGHRFNDGGSLRGLSGELRQRRASVRQRSRKQQPVSAQTPYPRVGKRRHPKF
jgi:hypothetical protein